MALLDIDLLCSSASQDGEFRITARHWHGWLRLRIGDGVPELLRVDDGQLRRVTAEALTPPAADTIRISASEADWRGLLAPVPAVGWHDLNNAHGFAIEAEPLVVAAHNLALRRLVELMREQIHGPADRPGIADSDEQFEQTVGRYVHLTIEGTRYRVYFEEAGTGIPVLMQHTAGGDSRQWRHLLADPQLRRHHRLIAYDLPYHGRSLPPTSLRWWEQEYRLTKAFLMSCVLELSAALELDRPVFMGCSIGGALAPDLAYHHPESFRAVIGINSSLGLPAPSTRERATYESYYSPYLSSEWKASYMLGRTSPTSPEAYRREVGWVYSQGAPLVFSGDMHYYRRDHDLTTAQARQIDTSQVGVYLLACEYDRLTVDGSTARLANSIAGAHYEVVPGAGHFGPAENPGAFTEPLQRVLADVRRETDSRMRKAAEA